MEILSAPKARLSDQSVLLSASRITNSLGRRRANAFRMKTANLCGTILFRNAEVSQQLTVIECILQLPTYSACIA